MRSLRRKPAEPEPPAEPANAAPARPSTVKGRPTPKRRDVSGRRPVITDAPRTRREAMRWQREQSAKARARGTTAPVLTGKARADAYRRGDPSVLRRRDQGADRKLARDWVDSRRMATNYMWIILIPVVVLGYIIPGVVLLALAALLGFVIEWYLAGRRIRALVMQRLGASAVRSGPWALGSYAGTRAYMPRRWRMPLPQVNLHDSI